MLMPIRRIAAAGVSHPFGDDRTVTQAFPKGIGSKESDPFLMCDYFDRIEDTGPVRNEDEFPVDWHPHRGFDIATYLKNGTGRHGDSLGNRVTFATPGMQWMSTGSGVEHAEGGATAKGVSVQGFQIWVNVPSDAKMDDPRYGTVPPEDLPSVQISDDCCARILAGEMFARKGPFETTQPVQMVDFELSKGETITFDIADGLDTAIVYVYDGNLANLNEQPVREESVVLLDASDMAKRGIELVASANEAAFAMLFAGKRINEPIAWYGPIVMNTDEELKQTFEALRDGAFPPVRVNWDYKKTT